MKQSVQDVAEGLLTHLRLSQKQASVLLDQSQEQQVLKVYIFDDEAARRHYAITRWRGYPVEFVTGVKVRPH